MPTSPDPQPGEMWSTGQGRTVEIVARDVVDDREDWRDSEVDAIAYRFLGGSMIHLRAVSSLTNWTKASFE